MGGRGERDDSPIPLLGSADQEVINYKLGPARAGREPYATWLKLPADAPIPYLENVEVVVVGGSGNIRWSVNECAYRTSVKVDDWK